MLTGERLQLRAPAVCEAEMHLTVIGSVAPTREQSPKLRSLRQLDHTVMTYVKCLSRLSDRWSVSCQVSAHNQQQLMQGGCQPGIVGCLLAPA